MALKLRFKVGRGIKMGLMVMDRTFPALLAQPFGRKKRKVWEGHSRFAGEFKGLKQGVYCYRHGEAESAIYYGFYRGFPSQRAHLYLQEREA